MHVHPPAPRSRNNRTANFYSLSPMHRTTKSQQSMLHDITHVRAIRVSSMCMVDTTSQLESTAPELLPLWIRHGHQVPEELARDLNLGGVR